jgi:serine/threonine-protein phosphatase 6 regulatory subunit 3
MFKLNSIKINVFLKTISPVNDLLDRGEFTLEDLLEEDELIQEVKSKNERLIELLVEFSFS